MPLVINMGKDLEEYEKDYLEKLEKKKEPSEEEKIEKEREFSKEIENLNIVDYTLLESERRENLLLCLHHGFVEILDSTEKLFRLGLIKKLDRKLTFSEKEKLERQKDTPQFKQYAARIQRIMDSETEQRIREYQANLGLRNLDDPMDVTDKGKQILEMKRKELEIIWKEMNSAYDGKNKQLFQKKVESNKSFFPLFLIMGFTNGAMMGAMMGNMGMNSEMYMQDMDMAYEQGYADAGGALPAEGDFGDAGGDGGGFMDAGFQPGF